MNMNLDRERIKRAALNSGFELKEQDDGTVDLNEYVYHFAETIIAMSRSRPFKFNDSMKK